MGQIANHKRALLITGTIVPNSNFVAYTNIEQRRQEYYDSLLFYANEFPNDALFFLENSVYDFITDEGFTKLLNNKNITLLKFPVSDKVAQGKGYQEFEMLDSAIEKLLGLYTHFIKITGRYKVTNIKAIAHTSYKCMIADSHKKYKVTQTNVFCVTANFYNTNFKNLYKQVNDAEGKFIEHVIYETLIQKKILNTVLLFPENPIVVGFSGSYGGSLNRNKYKMILRNIERKILVLFKLHEFIIEY